MKATILLAAGDGGDGGDGGDNDGGGDVVGGGDSGSGNGVVCVLL